MYHLYYNSSCYHFCTFIVTRLTLVIDFTFIGSLLLSAVCRQLVKDYRTAVRHCRELERNIKAEKYKMAGCGSVYMCSLTFVQ